MSVSQRTFRRFYPDQRKSGTLSFYGALREATEPGARILNLGAGPGDAEECDVFAIRDLRAPGLQICGCDPDPEVLHNAQLDEAKEMQSDGRIPYDDGIFDLVYSDYVLEHVEHPDRFLAEVFRVLKPSGTFHFRTPNLYHYVSIAARLLPHVIHSRIANRARSLEEGAHEPYPTFHRMNTRRALRRLASRAGFSHVEFIMVEAEPSYLMFNTLAFLMGVAYERTVNRAEWLQGLRANIIGTLVK